MSPRRKCTVIPVACALGLLITLAGAGCFTDLAPRQKSYCLMTVLAFTLPCDVEGLAKGDTLCVACTSPCPEKGWYTVTLGKPVRTCNIQVEPQAATCKTCPTGGLLAILSELETSAIAEVVSGSYDVEGDCDDAGGQIEIDNSGEQIILRGLSGNDDLALQVSEDGTTGTVTGVTQAGQSDHTLTLTPLQDGLLIMSMVHSSGGSCDAVLTPAF